VEVTKLRDLSQEHIVDYGDMVEDQARTPTYARQRFGAIKSIINFGPKRAKWAEDAKRAFALCAVLVPPKKSSTDPRPISIEHFHALYRVADQQVRTMLLLMLNACMYGGEVAALHWSDLNLAKAVLTTERSKTSVVRVATLWAESVAALRQVPRQTNAVFLTDATRMQHNYQTVYKSFKAVRKAAKLDGLVQLSDIRDGSYTAAVEAGVDLNVCRLLAGHVTGISDHYVKRRPTMVADACDSIRNAYRIAELRKARSTWKGRQGYSVREQSRLHRTS
jgi:integrase